jgi:hypothetical protein
MNENLPYFHMEDVLLSRGVVSWYEDWLGFSVRWGGRDPSLALRRTKRDFRWTRGGSFGRGTRSFAGAQDDKQGGFRWTYRDFRWTNGRIQVDKYKGERYWQSGINQARCLKRAFCLV